MSLDLLKEAFVEALGLPAGYDVAGLEYRAIPEWDSLAHLALVTTMDGIRRHAGHHRCARSQQLLGLRRDPRATRGPFR